MISKERFKELLERYDIKIAPVDKDSECGFIINGNGEKKKITRELFFSDQLSSREAPIYMQEHSFEYELNETADLLCAI